MMRLPAWLRPACGHGRRRAVAAFQVAFLGMCLVLAGCKPAPEKAAPSTPRNGVANALSMNAMMDAAFGGDQQVIGQHSVLWRAELMLPVQLDPAPARATEPVSVPQASGAAVAQASWAGARLQDSLLRRLPVMASPRQVVRLNDETAVLLFEAHAEQARPDPAQARPAYLGAVFFNRLPETPDGSSKPNPKDQTRKAESWSVGRFQPYVDALGHDGTAGDSQVYKLAAERYLVTFAPAQCVQGLCSKWLNGYLLQPDGMALVLQARLAANNVKAHADCAARLEADTPVHKTPARSVRRSASAASAAEQGHACFDINGEISPLSREAATADVTLRFSGVVSDVQGRRQNIQQVQRFRLQDGLYSQIDGGPNPVPEW